MEITENYEHHEHYKTIKNFIESNKIVYSFPMSLTKKERNTIHEIATQFNIVSFSIGFYPNRFITIKNEKRSKQISETDIKNFIKDFNLPIPIYKSPYFEYFIELYDDHYKIKDKLILLKEFAKEAEINKKSLKSYQHYIKDKLICDIKTTEAYQNYINKKHLLSKDTQICLPERIHIYSTHEYKEKYYISIDMIKGNFNSLKYFDPGLVLNCDSWEELIGKYTQLQYFVEAKHIRQMIFGHLIGTGAIQRQMLEKVYQAILKYDKENNKNFTIRQAGNEELIIITTEDSINEDTASIKNILANMPNKLGTIWRVEPFKIFAIPETTVFVKHIYDNSIKYEYVEKFKCINKDFFAQVYKKYRDIPINDNDMKTMKGDFIVTFDEQLFGSSNET
jgi:hypothetical protein